MEVCSNFTPNPWKEIKCRICFHLKDEHSNSPVSEKKEDIKTVSLSNVEHSTSVLAPPIQAKPTLPPPIEAKPTLPPPIKAKPTVVSRPSRATTIVSNDSNETTAIIHSPELSRISRDEDTTAVPGNESSISDHDKNVNPTSNDSQSASRTDHKISVTNNLEADQEQDQAINSANIVQTVITMEPELVAKDEMSCS